MPHTILQSTTLWSTKNGADKTYTAAIVSNPAGGWDVIAENGPRGGTQTRQPNKATAVDEATARKSYEKLVTSKIKSGGYKPLDTDPIAVAVSNERDGKSAGVPVALLHFIDRAEIGPLLERGFVLQQKHDGQRRLVIVRDGADVAGVKRTGEYVPLPPAIADAAAALGDAIIDGEIIGDTLHVFDAQRIGGEDIASQGFMKRFVALKKALARNPSSALSLVTVFHYPEALAELERLRDAGAEGIVLRNPHAPYQDGRPKQGGHLFKFKFYSTVAVEVIRHNDQHSVGVAVSGVKGERIDVGNVTLPPSLRKPRLGSILDVRYLYAYCNGSLYQPTYQRIRDDVTEPDAADTLAYKGEGVAA